MSLLDDIFHGDCGCFYKDDIQTEDAIELRRIIRANTKKLATVLTDEQQILLDELTNSIFDYSLLAECERFKSGVAFAVQFILEAQTQQQQQQ